MRACARPDIDLPEEAIVEPGASVRATPVRDGKPLGLDLVDLSSSAAVDPLGDGCSAIVGDAGAGVYVFAFGEPRALGETTLSLRVDGETLGRTLTVIVKSCDGPPEECQRPQRVVVENPADGGEDDQEENDDGN